MARLDQASAHRMRSLFHAALVLCTSSVFAVSCSVSKAPPAGSAKIPAPPWVQDTELQRLPDGRTQLSFEVDEQYPSSRVRDFYAQWAADHGWTKISPATEVWSADQWQTYVAQDGTKVDQWTVHWRSPDGEESIYLALLHRGNRAHQEVYVIRSPFFLLEDAELRDMEDMSSDTECPEGTLKEPVARHRPLPTSQVIRDRCPGDATLAQLLFTVASTGHVESVNLVQGTGCAYADEQLLYCVSQWRFDPATCDGHPVAVERGLAVSFDEGQTAPPDLEPCLPPEAEEEL